MSITNAILRMRKLKDLAIDFYPEEISVHEQINKLCINIIIKPYDQCIDEHDELIKSLRKLFKQNPEFEFHPSRCIVCSKNNPAIDKILMLENLINHSDIRTMNLYNKLLILLFLDGKDIEEVQTELIAKIT